MVATTVLASPSRAASLAATPPRPPRATLAAAAAPARTPTEGAIFEVVLRHPIRRTAGVEILLIWEFVLLQFELASCSAGGGGFMLRFVPKRSCRLVFGDGYVGTAQDAVKIRRREKQREAERRKIEELKNKSADGQPSLLQFGSSTSEDLVRKQNGDRAIWEYPFAVAGVNISFMIIQMLNLQAVKPRSLFGAVFLKLPSGIMPTKVIELNRSSVW